MKLLYIAPLPIDFENLDGVPKKIMSHCKVLSKHFDVDLIYYHDGRVRLRHMATGQTQTLGRSSSKLDVLWQAPDVIKENGYACMYIRYPQSDYLFLRLLRQAKKQGIRIAMEIPTYPYDLEGPNSLRGNVIKTLDRTFRKRLHPYVDRIVTYSDDREIYGVRTINTINGFDFDKMEADLSPIDVNTRIDLIAVAAMYRVHGYDRLIKGLQNYYAKGGSRNVVLKLVGMGPEYAAYKQLTEECGMTDHVVFYGALFGEDLEKVYRMNAVGVNSLAIHRLGLENESTLKTKEYAAKGLPVLSSSYVDAFSEAGNERYTHRISSDEEPVDIEKLIEFVDGIYSRSSLEEIRREIRAEGLRTCDVNITMKPVVDFLLGSERN